MVVIHVRPVLEYDEAIDELEPTRVVGFEGMHIIYTYMSAVTPGNKAAEEYLFHTKPGKKARAGDYIITHHPHYPARCFRINPIRQPQFTLQEV